ncbi:MAG: glycoside hydrolase family 95 protein, partial [Bacteroidales bacterium]|nr:glycoside hydrolase family 95 protein [Bacteroidales bacterium]
MKKSYFFFHLFLLFASVSFAFSPSKIRFRSPAVNWLERMPLGNGRVGMMPSGGVELESITLNESSMWSGSEQNAMDRKAYGSLGKIRSLIFDNRNDEAEKLMDSVFVCRGKGSGYGRGKDLPYGSYQIFA